MRNGLAHDIHSFYLVGSSRADQEHVSLSNGRANPANDWKTVAKHAVAVESPDGLCNWKLESVMRGNKSATENASFLVNRG